MASRFGQKFVTTDITSGVRIHVQQRGIRSVCTMPARLKLELYLWNISYLTTIGGTALVIDRAMVPSEEIESGGMWVYLLWKPIPAQTYLWLLSVIVGHDTGAFQVFCDSDSVESDSFVDSDNLPLSGDFESEVFSLASASFESALSVGDMFGSYQMADGHATMKINRGTTGSPNYTNSVHAQDPVTDGTKKIGRIGSGSIVKHN